MNAHVTPPRGTVALVGLAPPDLDGARDAAVLAGARVCSDPVQASLILASPSAPVPEGVPCVRVGQGGQVRLPADTALLVSLIAEASSRTRRSGAVWVVAGIAGGVGVTGVVRLLARARGRRRGIRWGGWRGERGVRQAGVGDAVVVDASGSVPGAALAGDHDVPGVRWADLDVSEDSYLPSLRDHLPVVGGSVCPRRGLSRRCRRRRSPRGRGVPIPRRAPRRGRGPMGRAGRAVCVRDPCRRAYRGHPRGPRGSRRAVGNMRGDSPSMPRDYACVRRREMGIRLA